MITQRYPLGDYSYALLAAPITPPASAVGAEHRDGLIGVGVLALGALAWAMLASRVRARARHPLVLPRLT